MTKLFKATWGAGYKLQKSEVIGLDLITEANGWWEENIEAIQNSQIGDIVDCSDIGGDLIVERVQ
jgi:hypothetical protein